MCIWFEAVVRLVSNFIYNCISNYEIIRFYQDDMQKNSYFWRIFGKL